MATCFAHAVRTGSIFLSLQPSCVIDGQQMYLNCCDSFANNEQPKSWNTDITGRTTTLLNSGLPHATFVNSTGGCELDQFIATLQINGTRIYCSNGNMNSNNVTVLVTTGCESAVYACVQYIHSIVNGHFFLMAH